MANYSLGTALLELAANTARFTSDLGRALSAAEKFKRDADRAFRTIGITVGVAGFVRFIDKSIEAADRLNDLKTRTGASAQELLVMEGAALRSGVQLEAVSDVASKLSRRLQEASQGTGDAANAYAAMGIKVTDASGKLKNLDVILKEVGGKFRTYEDGAGKAALATAAMGKGGDKLIPFVEALKETQERFEKLGITISGDVLKQADEFKDRMQDLNSVTGALGKGIAAALLPHLISGANALLEFQKNSDLVKASVDGAVVPIKIMATGFITLTGAIAAASRAALINFEVLDKLKSLDFKGAWSEFQIGLSETKGIFDATAATVDALWKKHEEGAKKAAAATTTVRPPGIPDLAQLKAANDALAKLLDARAKLAVDAEKEAGERRTQLLDQHYAWNLLSERDYWTQKLQIQREAVAREIAVLDAQIARQQQDVKKAGAGTKEYNAAQRELEETLAKRAKLEADIGHATAMMNFKAADSLQAYQDKITNINAELLELKGNVVDAARARQELSNRDLRKKFMTEGDQGALESLNNLERMQRAQVEFNALREEQEMIVARLQIQEERIQNTLRTGAIGELDALHRTSEARRAAAEQLEAVARSQEAVAASSPSPKLALQAEQARASLERLRSESDLLAQKFDTVISDSLGNAFADFITGSKTASEAFKSFANSVITEMSRIYAKQLATQLVGGSGVGGLLGKVFEGMFTFGGGGMSDAAAQAYITSITPTYATGTDYVPYDMIAKVHQGEKITPASQNFGGQAMEINIINPPGQPATAKQAAPRFDAGKMIIDVVLTGARSDANFRDGLRGALGAPV